MTHWRHWFSGKRHNAATSPWVYDARPPQATDYTPLTETRFVVVDLETTGLNVMKDLVIAIGAVAIERGEIQLAQQYDATLHRPSQQANASTLIHGISPEEMSHGKSPQRALGNFLSYAGQCIFLAFHAPFDHAMLRRALRYDLDLRLQHSFWDVAEWAPALYPNLAHLQGLDAWLEQFGLSVSNRHNASADAYATAELCLILLKEAERQAIDTLAQMNEKITTYRRLKGMKS